MSSTFVDIAKFVFLITISQTLLAQSVPLREFKGLPPNGDGVINDWVCTKLNDSAVCLAAGFREDAKKNKHALLLTSHNGVNWFEQTLENLPAPSFFTKVSCSLKTDICIAAGLNNDKPILAQSTDHLETWTLKPLPAVGSINYLTVASCSSGYCVIIGSQGNMGFSEPQILQTQNGGKAWQVFPLYVFADNLSGGCTGESNSVTCLFYGGYWDTTGGTTLPVSIATYNRGETWTYKY